MRTFISASASAQTLFAGMTFMNCPKAKAGKPWHRIMPIYQNMSNIVKPSTTKQKSHNLPFCFLLDEWVQPNDEVTPIFCPDDLPTKTPAFGFFRLQFWDAGPRKGQMNLKMKRKNGMDAVNPMSIQSIYSFSKSGNSIPLVRGKRCHFMS